MIPSGSCVLIDGKMQGDGRIAAVNRVELLDICTRLCVGVVIPCVSVASGVVKGEGFSVEDG